MPTECKHEYVHQFSTMYVNWGWMLRPDGTYEPEDTYSKVLDEETDHFECADCGLQLFDESRADGVHLLAADEC